MPKPTMDNYLTWLNVDLRKQKSDIDNNVQAIIRRHNAQGALYGGATVRVIHRETHERFEGAVKSALGVLKKAQQVTGLDADELRKATEEALRAFMETAKASSRPKILQQVEDRRAVSSLLAEFHGSLDTLLMGFDTGLLDISEPEAPPGMSINIGRDMIGSGIQQGSPGPVRKSRSTPQRSEMRSPILKLRSRRYRCFFRIAGR